MTRQPRAFRLDNADVVTTCSAPQRARTPAPRRRRRPAPRTRDGGDRGRLDGALVPLAPRRGLSWGGVLMSALGGLVTLALGLGLERLIVDLFVASPALGWVALGRARRPRRVPAVVVREIAGMFRERRIEKLREAAIDAIAVKDHEAAKRVVRDLIALYGERTHTAAGRKRLAAWADEIIEADDRIALAERELVAPLDLAAKRAVAGAAKQVSVVTAISPRAIVDVAFVIFAAVRLLRRISMIYWRPPGPPRLPAPRPRRLRPSRGHGRRRGRRQHRAAGAWSRPCGANLGEARRGRAQRPHDGALRPCGDRRLPPAAFPARGAAAARRRRRRAVGRGAGGGAWPLRSFPPLFGLGARLRHRAAGRAVGFLGYRRIEGRGTPKNSIYFLWEPFGVPADRARLALKAWPVLPASGSLRHVRRSLVQGSPRLVGGRVSAPDPGLARGFSPGEVGRVRPSPDPLPALQGSPAVVRGSRTPLIYLIFLPARCRLSPA